MHTRFESLNIMIFASVARWDATATRSSQYWSGCASLNLNNKAGLEEQIVHSPPNHLAPNLTLLII